MEQWAITNGSVVTMGPAREVLHGGTVLLANGRIEAVLPATAAVPPGYRLLDAKGCAVMPGLVNAHTHLYASFGRSLSFGEDLLPWLLTQKGLIAQFTDEDFATCIEVGIALNLKSGNTCVVDAMAMPADGGPRRHRMALGLAERYRLQYVLARAYASQMENPAYTEDLATIEREMVSLIEEYHGQANGRLRVSLSPNMPWVLPIEGFRMTRRLADRYGVGIHMHTSESVDYAHLVEKAHGHRSNIRVLQDGGCLGPDVQLLGCAHLTDAEFEVVERTGTRMILDPISGTTLGVGEPPILRAAGHRHPTALSTNGMASAGGQDMFEAMKTALSLARVRAGGPTALSVQRVLDMATIEAARVLGLDQDIGSLEVGKKADVICVDLDHLFCAPTFDVVSTVVCACTSRDVRDVFVAGALVVRDRVLQTVDEAALTGRATALAAAAIERTRRSPDQTRPA